MIIQLYIILRCSYFGNRNSINFVCIIIAAVFSVWQIGRVYRDCLALLISTLNCALEIVMWFSNELIYWYRKSSKSTWMFSTSLYMASDAGGCMISMSNFCVLFLLLCLLFSTPNAFQLTFKKMHEARILICRALFIYAQ